MTSHFLLYDLKFNSALIDLFSVIKEEETTDEDAKRKSSTGGKKHYIFKKKKRIFPVLITYKITLDFVKRYFRCLKSSGIPYTARQSDDTPYSTVDASGQHLLIYSYFIAANSLQKNLPGGRLRSMWGSYCS